MNEQTNAPPYPYDNMDDWELMEQIRVAAREYHRKEQEANAQGQT